MIRNRILLKSLAVFLVTEMLLSTLLPTLSWALTAGPSAPEFSSFEPVDTTDMVNLLTGELVYNTPVLEVPGPSGGYPLSLSYHAGIKPGQEASWVGLGWTLNPGAISRTVNGFADDFVEARRQVKDYWAGGSSITKTYTIGLNTGITGVSANISVARTQDTFKGFSTNAYAGVSISPVAMALSQFRSDLIGNSGPVGRNDYTGQMREEIFKSTASALSSALSMDVSIGSNGIRSSVTVAGRTFNQRNNSAGAISSFTNTTNIGTVPLFNLGNLTLKNYYTRYWSDQSDALFAYGALYSARNTQTDHYDEAIVDNYSEFKSFSNDIYNIYDASPQAVSDLKDEADAAKQIGGSLPSYDQYYVTGQGIGGMIEPYIFENGDMKGQNYYYRDPVYGYPYLEGYTLKHNSLKSFTGSKRVDFRFKNDFSNSLMVDPSTITEVAGVLGVNDHDLTFDASGFDNSTNRQKLEGSRHIDWYTNDEITNGTAKAEGFIDCYNLPTDRSMSMDVNDNYLQPEASLPIDMRHFRGRPDGLFKTERYEDVDPYADFVDGHIEHYIRFRSLKPTSISLAERIGGFKITNETGVTYHYALPVYNYNEYTRSKLKKPYKGAATITEIKNNEPYAYTWLLTAITGPDYVDRGGSNGLPNGILDDADFGYWVKFDYGKWTDSYQWRTPFTGYMSDPESDYESFSYGIKELYYLDAIETKSHKAIFIKSKRRDGRGVTSRLEGGCNPRIYTMHYKWQDPSDFNEFKEMGVLKYQVSPVSTLKLDAIYLFDKKDLAGITLTRQTGSKYDDHPIDNPGTFGYIGADYSFEIPHSNPVKYVTIKEGEDFVEVKYHNPEWVYDDGDLEQLPLEMFSEFKSNALKSIEFKTDYSLSHGVSNSIGFFSDFATDWPGENCYQFPFPPEPYTCDIENYNVDFEWPRGGCIDPTLRMPECCNESHRSWFYNQTFCNNAYGDYFGNEVLFYKTGKLTLKAINILGHGGVQLIPPTSFGYEKNPLYDSRKYDDWGFYKSDFQQEPSIYFPASDVFAAGGPIPSRKITSASAADADAWSLTSIKSPLGTDISISYEPNTYSKSVYNDHHIFGIAKVERIGEDQVKVILKEKGLNLQNYFTVNSTVAIKAMVVSKVNSLIVTYPSEPDFYESSGDEIISIGDDFLILSAPLLNGYLKPGRVKLILGVSHMLTPYFISGALSIPDPAVNKYAGGVRVRAIAVDEFAGHQSITEFSYKKPGTSISSGVTSYKPYYSIGVQYPREIDFFSGMFNDSGDNNEPHADEATKKKLVEYKTDFQKRLNQLYEKVLLFGREAPAPGAMYEYVTVKNRSDDLYHNFYTVHQFRVFEESMITLDMTDYGTPEKQRRNVVLRNEASDVGNPVAEYRYSTIDNMLLYQKNYGYLYDQDDRDFEASIKAVKQGVVEQSFHKHITVKDYHWRGYNHPPFIEGISTTEKAVVTKKEERSNVLTVIEEKNFKYGISTVTEYHHFDFLSGAALKTVTRDAYGNRYLTEVVPAYNLEESEQLVYPGMGPKLFNPSNLGMLTQSAATYVYRVGEANEHISLVSADVQTWKKDHQVMDESGIGLSTDPRQQQIWRKHAQYSWLGTNATLDPDGLYPIASFQDFSFLNPNSNSDQWQKTSEINLYDVGSHALMVNDINGNFAATRMSPDQARVMATASNSKYGEFAYSGAEESLPNAGVLPGWVVQKGSAAEEVLRTDETDLVTAHTGQKALRVTASGQKAFAYTFTTEPERAHHASVWVNSIDGRLYYSIDGGAPQPSPAPLESRKAGAWYLVMLDIPKIDNSSSLEVWCETAGAACNFDDFRVHPYDASMTSYVYNRWGELSHVLDNNNVFTEYRYDAAGRLKEIHKETFNHNVAKTSEVIYHHAGN